MHFQRMLHSCRGINRASVRVHSPMAVVVEESAKHVTCNLCTLTMSQHQPASHVNVYLDHCERANTKRRGKNKNATGYKGKETQQTATSILLSLRHSLCLSCSSSSPFASGRGNKIHFASSLTRQSALADVY